MTGAAVAALAIVLLLLGLGLVLPAELAGRGLFAYWCRRRHGRTWQRDWNRPA